MLAHAAAALFRGHVHARTTKVVVCKYHEQRLHDLPRQRVADEREQARSLNERARRRAREPRQPAPSHVQRAVEVNTLRAAEGC